MFKKFEYKPYSQVFQSLNSEIRTKRAYNEKIVELELLVNSNSNLIGSNSMVISSLFAFIIGFMFDRAINLYTLEKAEMILSGFVMIAIPVATLWVVGDTFKMNRTQLESQQLLLVLKQEEDILNKDR